MTRAFVVCVGAVATLLVSCGGTGGAPATRIVTFTTDERTPRNVPVTLEWQTENAGAHDGLFSCQLTRRLSDEPTGTPLDATCNGSVTEVPPAPLTATTVHYDLAVLKEPYDASDPYLTETRSVTLDTAMYATLVAGIALVDAWHVGTLADGSAITTGIFTSTATFGATTLTNVGGSGTSDTFVAKIDQDGGWAWAAHASGTRHVYPIGVRSFADGSAIVVGTFEETATFGTTTLTSSGSADVFVARVDPDGHWDWVTRAGGTAYAGGHAVSPLADGSAIVSGSFQASATFGTTSITSAGNRDTFVARVNPDGAWSWATRSGGADHVRPSDVSALADGGAIVSGSFQGTATFGTTSLTSAGGSDAFVARLDSDGAWLWATRGGGQSNGGVTAASPLADGSAITTGSFAGTATFGATTLTSAGGADVFVARVDPDGSWAWATRAGGARNANGRGVGVVADGGAIVIGGFVDFTTFGATTLTSAGTQNGYVARIGADGAW